MSTEDVRDDDIDSELQRTRRARRTRFAQQVAEQVVERIKPQLEAIMGKLQQYDHVAVLLPELRGALQNLHEFDFSVPSRLKTYLLKTARHAYVDDIIRERESFRQAPPKPKRKKAKKRVRK